MNKLFPIPSFSLLRIIYNNGGLSTKGFLHALPLFAKATVTEPFRWIELALHNRKIKTHQLQHEPIFILGYYRSGTTYLQQLFMQDERFGYTSLFQTLFPELMLSYEKSITPVLEKLAKKFKSQNHFHRTQLAWHSPGEEDIALMCSLNPNTAQWGTLFPENAMEYFQKYTLFENLSYDEINKWKEQYLYLIKKISIANKNKQLVLKSPPNTARIQILLEMFPNAKFIYIARCPLDIYSSCKHLGQMIHKHYMLGKYAAATADKIIIETYSQIMERYIADKQLIPEDRLIEICYEDFIKHPIATIENVYQHLNLASFEFCRTAMNKYVQVQKNYQMLRHHLNGDELIEVQEQLSPYISYWKNIRSNAAFKKWPYELLL